jgi:hypothetical protein
MRTRYDFSNAKRNPFAQMLSATGRLSGKARYRTDCSSEGLIKFAIDENGQLCCVTDLIGRYGVYLDNDSLIRLAKHDEGRRRRLVEWIRHDGALLFSLTNAMEIAGPQGASANAIRLFLNSIGPYWIPLELNPFRVLEKERSGLIGVAPVSSAFMKGYILNRNSDLYAANPALIESSGDFFELGSVLEWVQEQRESIRANTALLDSQLECLLAQTRLLYDRDPTVLDREYPAIPFSRLRPGTFVFNHLIRLLVVEAKSYRFKPHDGADFYHAVLAASYASVATLDKQWKERIQRLPEAVQLAKMYYQPELDSLVDFVESLPSTTRPAP